MKTVIRVVFGVLILGFAIVSSAGDEPAKNCKLTIRTTKTGGKTKVEIREVAAISRDDCKQQAKALETNPDPESIEKIRVSYGFREPR